MTHNNVRQMFDQISSVYDRTNRFLSFGLDRRWRRALAALLPKRNDLKLLDIATGTGEQISSFLQKGILFDSIIGIDPSQEMLKIARKKLPQVSFECCFAESLPFSDQTFDVCTISFGIRNVQDRLKALSEIYRVTKPSGCCVILEFSIPRNRFRTIYLFYLRYIMPILGWGMTRRYFAYRYLNQTIESFPAQEQFLEYLRQTNWARITTTKLMFGCITIYQAEKNAKD